MQDLIFIAKPQTLEDQAVTVRVRDDLRQIRMGMDKVADFLREQELV